MRSLCILGDSIGKGVVWNENNGRYTVLDDSFSALLAEKTSISVKNHAAFGSTIERGIKIAQRHLGELGVYDAVLLEFGGNDCDFDWASIANAPDDDHSPKTPISTFEEKYLELIAEVKKAGGTPLLMNLPPIDSVRYFQRVSTGIDGGAVLEWLGDKSRIYRWHEMYSIAVQRVAKLTGTPVIDIRTAFLSRRDCPELICADGIHPNRSGHMQIAETVAEFLCSFGMQEACVPA